MDKTKSVIVLEFDNAKKAKEFARILATKEVNNVSLRVAQKQNAVEIHISGPRKWVETAKNSLINDVNFIFSIERFLYEKQR